MISAPTSFDTVTGDTPAHKAQFACCMCHGRLSQHTAEAVARECPAPQANALPGFVHHIETAVLATCAAAGGSGRFGAEIAEEQRYICSRQ